MPLQQNVVIVLEVRASKKIDSELTKAKTKVQGWAATLTREMKNVFKRATFFRFSTIGINSFFNSIRFARQEVMAFQDALGDIVKVDIARYVSLNSKMTQQLSEDISDAANKYGILRIEAAKTLEAITVAGYRGADAMKILDASLLGQSATGLKAAEVFRAVLLPAMLQFKVGIGDLESALDILVTTQANAAVGFGDFAGAFRAGGSTLAGTTKSLNEAAALVAALGEVTQESGATVGTFFKTLSPRLLANPGTKKILSQLNVDVADPKTNAMRSMLDILLDVNKAMKGLGSATKRTMFSIISGIRQGNRLTATMNALNRVEELVEKNSKAAGDTRRRVSIEQQKLSVKWRKVQNKFASSLEKALLPVMDDLIASAGSIAQLGAGAVTVLFNIAQAIGLISKQSTEELHQLNIVRDIKQSANKLSEEGSKAVNNAIAKMAFRLSRHVSSEYRQIPGDRGDIGWMIAAAGKLGRNIVGADPAITSRRNLASIKDIISTYDEMISEGHKFGMGSKQKIAFLRSVVDEVNKELQKDKELKRPGKKTVLKTGISEAENQGSKFGDALDAFNQSLREGAPATSIKKLQARMTNALAAIDTPAKSFNRGLLQQRKAMVEVNAINKESRAAALKAAEKQALADLKGLDAAAAKTIQTDLQAAKDKDRVDTLKDQVNLAEFDAKAMRRLNTELNSMKDKTKDASSKLATSTRRLGELRIEEAKASATAAKAIVFLRDSLVEYEIGLIRAGLESKKITGEIGGLAQQLAGSKKVIPAFLESLTKELQQPSRGGGGFGGDNIIKGELKLSSLRRESLREQLDLTRQILDRQREIGSSFFGLEAGGRNDLVKGFGAIQNLFGRFGGDVGKFQSMSTQDLNAFGRQLLSLPDEMKNSILKATEFIPEGATVAGFTGKQIKDLIATASLGRASGTGILDIGDLQAEAADSTTKLASLQTDSLANSIEQLRVAQQQLDQQKAQTEVARMQVEMARQQLSILTSDQNARRNVIQGEMDFIRRQNQSKGPAMGTDAILGHATLARIQAFDQTMTHILGLSEASAKEGWGSAETTKVLTERFTRFRTATEAADTSLAALNESLLKLSTSDNFFVRLNDFISEGEARDISKIGNGVPNATVAPLMAVGGQQTPPEKSMLEFIQLLRPLTDTIHMDGENSIELNAMLKKMNEAFLKGGSPVSKEILIKLAGETIEKFEITGLAELPMAMARILEAHPEIKNAKALRKNLGMILTAMIEAGIEAGAFPSSMRSQVSMLNFYERIDPHD